jgi:hypothetical protein
MIKHLLLTREINNILLFVFAVMRFPLSRGIPPQNT